MTWLLAIVEFLRGLAAVVANKQAAAAKSAEQDDGAARAEADTVNVIAEGANEQARINSAHRDARGVGERLLNSADAGDAAG